MTNNLVRNDFKRVKLGVLIVLVSIGLFLFADAVLGTPILEEDFEACDIQELCDGINCGWEGICNYNSNKISTDDPHTGSKSVRSYFTDSGFGPDSYKVGNAIEIGQLSFWIKPVCVDTGTSEHLPQENWQFILRENEFTGKIYLRITLKNNYCNVVNPVFSLWYNDSGEWILYKDDIAGGFYYEINLWWNADTDKFKIKFSSDSASDWFNAIAFNSLDTINISYMPSQETSYPFTFYSLANFFFDDITELIACDSENCELCETYWTCSNANCYWYYSIFLKEFYCVDLYEPSEEECGSFYKCQYCLTQEPCWAEINCEWANRGYGEKCYMIEPTIPPLQEEWVMPELEDCEVLSGTEKWLCEIKNFIAGAFLPSQEKLNSLNQTFGAFKDKFPFNYSQSLMRFFSEIQESFDDPKSIPIKILGQESNVSFEFWNEITTIGGQEETLKNVVFDFTTFVIIIAWGFWLISLIKRLF